MASIDAAGVHASAFSPSAMRLRLARRGEAGTDDERTAAPGAASPLRLLLVGSGERFGAALLQRLEAAGHLLAGEPTGGAAIARLDRDDPDAVLLDTSLADMSGFEACRRMRARSDVALLFVTPDAELGQRLRGFDAGADDYVVTPADATELESRVRAVLWRRARRRRGGGGDLEGPHGLRVRLRSHETLVGNRPVKLTPKEFALLALFLERRGEVLSSDAISRAIWGYETFGSRNFVEAHISRLRRKLSEAGADGVIETLRGVGYIVRDGARVDAAS